jgi:hypothetical protein
LLLAADRAPRLNKRSRPALIGDALRELETRAMEDRDREGYRKQPQAHDEALAWEAAAAWPAE